MPAMADGNPSINQEVWENVVQGTIYINKYDRFGNVISEKITAGGRTTISSEDRIVNEQNVHDKALNPFRNGTLMPIRLAEGVEDYAEIRANPNILTDEDLQVIFKLSREEFEARIASIDAPSTLIHLQEYAEKTDEAKVYQLNAIKNRRYEISGSGAGQVREFAGRKVVSTHDMFG